MTQLLNSYLRRFTAWYKAKPIADVLSAVQPLGMLVAVLSLLVAIIALFMTIHQIKESRRVHEATLFALAMERLSVARQMDQMDSDKRDMKRATKRHVNNDKEVKWQCSGKGKQLTARAGQIPVLERLARLEPSLRDIVAHDVNLVVTRSRREVRENELRGIDLENADLSRAGLRNTNLRNGLLSDATLTGADLDGSCLKDAILTGSYLVDADLAQSDLSGADLSKADLTRADLYRVNFSRANFKKATLTDADISGANFTRAKGLTQEQIDSACADEDNPPIKLPKDDVSKEPLEWKQKQCN